MYGRRMDICIWSRNTYQRLHQLICILKSEIVLAWDMIYKLQDRISRVLQVFITTICFIRYFKVSRQNSDRHNAKGRFMFFFWCENFDKSEEFSLEFWHVNSMINFHMFRCLQICNKFQIIIDHGEIFSPKYPVRAVTC